MRSLGAHACPERSQKPLACCSLSGSLPLLHCCLAAWAPFSLSIADVNTREPLIYLCDAWPNNSSLCQFLRRRSLCFK
jgi:hypothetical protein